MQFERALGKIGRYGSFLGNVRFSNLFCVLSSMTVRVLYIDGIRLCTLGWVRKLSVLFICQISLVATKENAICAGPLWSPVGFFLRYDEHNSTMDVRITTRT